MPFPLAHPAAVLPLRRYCPRFFNLPALVVGSMAPDLGYLFGRLHVDQFAHSLLGSLAFCLPAGILGVLLLYGVRAYALRNLSQSRTPALLQLPWPPLGPGAVLVLSVLVGTWTHLFLDSFTHKSGWLVDHVPWLELSLGSVAGHAVRVCSVLWYACSFVGVGLVFLAFRQWQSPSSPAPSASSARADWRGALLVASAVLPIELMHHLLPNWVGIVLVSLITLLLLALIVTRIGPTDLSVPR